LSNLKFALEVDPSNLTLKNYHAQCVALREKGVPTLPSSIALERAINPFLRSGQAEVVASAQRFDAAMTSESGAFATLRQWKNNYR
jgi:hydroxyacylglutathione hydrolase